MVFQDIQAILISEFTIITKFLDKPRNSKGGGRDPKFEHGEKLENKAKPPWGNSQEEAVRKFHRDLSNASKFVLKNRRN